MNPTIGIIDYGVGNLRSVAKILERTGVRAVVSSDPDALNETDGVILPGVGAFGAAMEKLVDSGLDRWLADQVGRHGRPVLGICLGMQLLARGSEESPGVKGLNLVAGDVRQIDVAGARDHLNRPLTLPHIGWNGVRARSGAVLFETVAPDSDFYFANSYRLVCSDQSAVAETEYGTRFICALEAPPVYGVQFHPEKSQKAGQAVLANFVRAATC
jgi:imidazole glycerol phosphate synthase glutamine amidotransferase subunit